MSKRTVGIKIADNIKGTRLENVSIQGFDTPIEVGENSDVTLQNVTVGKGCAPTEPSTSRPAKLKKGWTRRLEKNWPKS